MNDRPGTDPRLNREAASILSKALGESAGGPPGGAGGPRRAQADVSTLTRSIASEKYPARNLYRLDISWRVALLVEAGVFVGVLLAWWLALR